MKSIEAKRNHLFLFIFLSLRTIVHCHQRFKQTKMQLAFGRFVRCVIYHSQSLNLDKGFSRDFANETLRIMFLMYSAFANSICLQDS